MVDVQQQIDSVDRTVRTVEEVRVQTIAQEYASPIDDVWDAATTPERIERWFAPVEGDLRLGGRYQIVGNAGGEVLECAPPADGAAHYRITWEYGGGVSWVVVRLTDLGDERTRFELEHSGRVADVPVEFFSQYGSGATGVGWESGLLGLALHLAGSEGPSPAESDQWLGSEEGRAFVRAAATAWGAADVADGMAPDAAAVAVAGTYAFYTGDTSEAS